jgi:uncharacterized protein (DUF4213/DUF364 family)
VTENPVLERAYHTVTALRETCGAAPGRLAKVAIKRPWNVVLGTGGPAGLAFNFAGKHAVAAGPEPDDLVPEISAMIDRPLGDLVERYLGSADMQRRAVCLAAINALARPLLEADRLERAGLTWTAGSRLRDLVEPGDRVAVVGYGGVIRELMGRCRELHVTDMRPREQFQTLVIGREVERGPKAVVFHPAEENAEVLGAADAVFITGSTLVNGTFDQVAGWAGGARVRAIYGPSAQLPPEFFFASGLTHVLSTVIRDVARFEDDMLNDLDREAALRAHQDMIDITPPRSSCPA